MKGTCLNFFKGLAFTKAKPLPDRENKFTSTLRRLSTVRKRNKTKRKSTTSREKEPNWQSGTEPGSCISTSTPPDLRPSSTTSKESENEVQTSGYFRYIFESYFFSILQ